MPRAGIQVLLEDLERDVRVFALRLDLELRSEEIDLLGDLEGTPPGGALVEHGRRQGRQALLAAWVEARASPEDERERGEGRGVVREEPHLEPVVETEGLGHGHVDARDAGCSREDQAWIGVIAPGRGLGAGAGRGWWRP